MGSWLLLIDFGTSVSMAAIAHADGLVELVGADGARTIPSGIWTDSSGRVVVGLSAQRQARLAPERWERAPKRLLGQASPLRLGQTEVEVVAAVAEVLKRLSTEAIRRQGTPPQQVRLICPARWDARRRGALLVAAQMAGLGSPPLSRVPQLVEEPVAIGLSLAQHGLLPGGSRVALYNLGGGSLDLAVLESAGDGIVVRALGGIDGLGGERFDDLLYQEVVGNALASQDAGLARHLEEPPDASWRRAGEDLFREVRRAKEELSHSESVHLDPGPLIDVPLQLARADVEDLLRPQIIRTADELIATVELAGLRLSDLQAVYLAGGSSRMPLVPRVLFDLLGILPEALGEPKFLAIAGAASWSPQAWIEPEATVTTEAGRGLGADQTTDRGAERRVQPVAQRHVGHHVGGSSQIVATQAERDDQQPWEEWSPRPALEPGVAGRRRRLWIAGTSAVVLLVLAALVLYRGLESGRHPTRVLAASTSIPTPRTSGGTAGKASTATATALSSATHSATAQPAAGSTATANGNPAPYGSGQDIAAAWPALVPSTPGTRGTQGQTCQNQPSISDFSNGKLLCRFGNGVVMAILRYPSRAARDSRAAVLSAKHGVSAQRWSKRSGSGVLVTGRLLTADASASGGPFLWWTFDATPAFAMFAAWPGQSEATLVRWWHEEAPFQR